MTSKAPATGTERARDEQRTTGGPRYGGQPWGVADERGTQRFGHARNDDADPSELAPNDADHRDDDSPSGNDPAVVVAEVAGEIAGSAEHAGMGRGDQPRKSRSKLQDQG